MVYDFNWLYNAIIGSSSAEVSSSPAVASTIPDYMPGGGGEAGATTTYTVTVPTPTATSSDDPEEAYETVYEYVAPTSTPAPTLTPTPTSVVSSSTLSDITSDTINSWFSPGSSGVSAPTAAPATTGTPVASTVESVPSAISLWSPSPSVAEAASPAPYRIPEYRRSGSSRVGSLPYGESPSFEASPYPKRSDMPGYSGMPDMSSYPRMSDMPGYSAPSAYSYGSVSGPPAGFGTAPEGMDWAIRETPSGEQTWALVPEGESSRPSARPGALVRSDGSSTPGGSGDPGGGGGYYPSGYGGYGGATAGGEADVPETLGELTWWGPDAVTPLLKGWGKWLRELVEINAESRPVPYLFDFEPEVDESAELRTVLEDLEGVLGKPGGTAGVPAFADFTAGGKESLSPRMRAVLRELSDRKQRGGSTLGYIEQLIDESRGEGEDARPWEELLRMAQSGEGGESALDQLLAQYFSVAEEWDDTVPQLKTPQPGVGSVSGILKRLQRMLGVETADDASQTEKWQQLINKIPGASFEAQQLMHSLTFDQSGKWMTQSSSMLPNPAFT